MLLIILLVVVLILIVQKIQYEKTNYFQQTHISNLHMRLNKGRIGEYYIYKYLEDIPGYKRFLFNLYIPKGNDETTELDVVLLHESGIYIFESKNYSGWIFGNESQQYWTQTLPNGRRRTQKNHFYNPIWQNNGHIKWLQAFLGDQTLPIYSFIVFSNRCTLKNITLTSSNHYVVNRYNLPFMIKQHIAKMGVRLSVERIDEIFKTLYPLTQVENAVKIMHVNNIQQRTLGNDSHHAPIAQQIPSNEGMVCPRCGGGLVERISTKGDYQGKRFMGCSNYPKCRYIKNLPDIKPTSHNAQDRQVID